MSIVLGIDDLDPELEICANFVPRLKTEMCTMFTSFDT